MNHLLGGRAISNYLKKTNKKKNSEMKNEAVRGDPDGPQHHPRQTERCLRPPECQSVTAEPLAPPV